ncbi:hypothetical protein MRX96_013474 [Rhipicephalus microplus]
MLYWRLQRERTRSAPASSPGPPAAAEAGDTLGGGQPSSATAEFLDQTSDEGIENVSEEMNLKSDAFAAGLALVTGWPTKTLEC